MSVDVIGGFSTVVGTIVLDGVKIVYVMSSISFPVSIDIELVSQGCRTSSTVNVVEDVMVGLLSSVAVMVIVSGA